MIELHPEFLTKNGQKQFAVLPYEEFLKIEELLAYLENIQYDKDKDSLSVSLTEVSLIEIKNILIVDKLTHYQNIIKQILTEYERISAQVPDPDIDEVLMFDDQRSQYLWFNIGWKNNKRVKAISVYVRIKNEKIYIEEDWTEEGIATELLREGVPKEDIVLAFHDPETRKLTGYYQMDKLENYRFLIKKILTEYHQLFSSASPDNIEMLLAFDEQRDQYLWFQVGWTTEERIKGISVHIRIKNEKIYIEEDWTEEGIATELLREGVPKEDIVLAFHDPETRKLTEFAIA